MKRGRHVGIVGIVLALGLGFLGCGNDKTPTGLGGGPQGVVTEFSLPDVNPNSASYQDAVSPRDYLTKVSAWYFGHST